MYFFYHLFKLIAYLSLALAVGCLGYLIYLVYQVFFKKNDE
jgi:preprotein translocase subunit Sss1